MFYGFVCRYRYIYIVNCSNQATSKPWTSSSQQSRPALVQELSRDKPLYKIYIYIYICILMFYGFVCRYRYKDIYIYI